jgi:hypothetical protein
VYDEEGTFGSDGSTLALSRKTCLMRSYDGNGRLAESVPCSFGVTPWALRVESSSPGSIDITGIGVEMFHDHERRSVTLVRARM